MQSVQLYHDLLKYNMNKSIELLGVEKANSIMKTAISAIHNIKV
jgi:hypothetical protein